MKLVCTIVAVFAVCACASTRPVPVTTTAAELTTPEAPRGGKAQRSAQVTDAKDERRADSKRPGGGFSGWK